MVYDNFIQHSHGFWEHYFENISNALNQGKIKSPKGATVLFPNIILFSNCSGYYIMELLGATEEFTKLRIKKHGEKSIHRYFSHFDNSEAEEVINFDSANYLVKGLLLANKIDKIKLIERFPNMTNFEQAVICQPPSAKGSTISFGKNFKSCGLIDCHLINNYENIYRCKYIHAAYVVKNSININELQELYRCKIEREITGVYHVWEHQVDLKVASQFQNFYLFPSLRETTIGEFLNTHPEILKNALNCEEFIYEPYLKWIEHDGKCQDQAINPDFFY